MNSVTFKNIQGFKNLDNDETRAKVKINRWLRWLGHVLMKPNARIPKVRMVMNEPKEMGLSWGEVHAKAQDSGQRQGTGPYVPTGKKRISKEVLKIRKLIIEIQQKIYI